MILAKSYSVPVSTAIVTNERPFIAPVQILAGPTAIQPNIVITEPLVKNFSGTSSVQATGQDVSHSTTATQPV